VEQLIGAMNNNLSNTTFYNNITELLHLARKQVVRVVNQTMVLTYFEIGKRIVEEEQQGKERAEYGKQLLKGLSDVLTNEFGKGFSVRNIERMRAFYFTYQNSATLLSNSQESISATPLAESQKGQSPSTKFPLSWSHYIKLIQIDNEDERNFYEIEAQKNNWSVRELNRQYDSALYTRLALSRDKDKVKELSEKGLLIEKTMDAIKDPYILEFLGLSEKSNYSESDLEQELIDKLGNFLLELGTGFSFVARQKRITFDEQHFRIDLVFYHRILRCFVLIDLKIGKLKHQDIGQMQMYVNYYDREIRMEKENPTIGLILCQNKSESVVEYTLPENNEQIFASKYQTALPSKQELKQWIERQR
jgi:predicted nuclease of restriction endonuclease-like (RecB) superfamily